MPKLKEVYYSGRFAIQMVLFRRVYYSGGSFCEKFTIQIYNVISTKIQEVLFARREIHHSNFN